MDVITELPVVMGQAREDLAGNVSGRFSPEDWQSILREAERRLRQYQGSAGGESPAWQRVVREFHQERYWGFSPNYQKPRPPKKKGNLVLSFIFLVGISMTITNAAVVWLGQIYSHSDEAKDAWLFFLALMIVVGNFGYFLWRSRHHQD